MEAPTSSPSLAAQTRLEPVLPAAPARAAPAFDARFHELDMSRLRPPIRRSFRSRVLRSGLVLAIAAGLGVLGWVAYVDLTSVGSSPATEPATDRPVVSFPVIDDLSTP